MPKPKLHAVAKMTFRMSDVFLYVVCSECKTKLGTFRGHASEAQSSMFKAIREHNPLCGKIRALCGEESR